MNTTENIKTVTKHVITVNAADMKKRFCEAFMDILNDNLTVDNDMEGFSMELNRFQDDLNYIDKHGFRQAFKDGYTMMLLGGKEFDFVEEWFNRPGSAQEELCIRILDNDGNQMEIVPHVDLNY